MALVAVVQRSDQEDESRCDLREAMLTFILRFTVTIKPPVIVVQAFSMPLA